jgi:hypothetical protein
MLPLKNLDNVHGIFYAICYLTIICVHRLNLVEFGISILIFFIPISCYKCCDQGLSWFSKNLKDIKLSTKFFILTIILFITTHETHWESWIYLIWEEKIVHIWILWIVVLGLWQSFLGTPIVTRAWENIFSNHDTFRHITSRK